MCKKIEDAIRIVLQEIESFKKEEECLLEDALGRVLAEDIYAPISQPPFDRSPLDGYALSAKDSQGATKECPVTLLVIDEVMAGDVARNEITGGLAIRIMTGAPIPKGADCVIRQEDTDYGETTVQIYQELTSHANICDAGEDFQKGDCLVEKGSRLDAVTIGIIAGAGIPKVSVYEKVKVALLTSGDELIELGKAPAPGKIYNSNQYLLGARLQELGVVPVCIKTVKDSAEDMAQVIKSCIHEVDLVVSTGAVSVGKKDIMHQVFEILGARRLFWKIQSKPGSPVLTGVYQKKLLICLSGNPFGAIVNLELLVRPVLAELGQDPRMRLVKKQGVMACDFKKESPGRRFVRGIYEDGQVTLPKRAHISGAISSMKGCNCLLDIPGGNEGLQSGDRVCVWML